MGSFLFVYGHTAINYFPITTFSGVINAEMTRSQLFRLSMRIVEQRQNAQLLKRWNLFRVWHRLWAYSGDQLFAGVLVQTLWEFHTRVSLYKVGAVLVESQRMVELKTPTEQSWAVVSDAAETLQNLCNHLRGSARKGRPPSG